MNPVYDHQYDQSIGSDSSCHNSFEPVCAEDGYDQEQFYNMCFALRSGRYKHSQLRYGPCREEDNDQRGSDHFGSDTYCSLHSGVVCVVNLNDHDRPQQFDNLC